MSLVFAHPHFVSMCTVLAHKGGMTRLCALGQKEKLVCLLEESVSTGWHED